MEQVHVVWRAGRNPLHIGMSLGKFEINRYPRFSYLGRDFISLANSSRLPPTGSVLQIQVPSWYIAIKHDPIGRQTDLGRRPYAPSLLTVRIEKVTYEINTPPYPQVSLRSGDDWQISPSVHAC
jgi:hypothetical protein